MPRGRPRKLTNQNRQDPDRLLEDALYCEKLKMKLLPSGCQSLRTRPMPPYHCQNCEGLKAVGKKLEQPPKPEVKIAPRPQPDPFVSKPTISARFAANAEVSNRPPDMISREEARSQIEEAAKDAAPEVREALGLTTDEEPEKCRPIFDDDLPKLEDFISTEPQSDLLLPTSVKIAGMEIDLVTDKQDEQPTPKKYTFSEIAEMVGVHPRNVTDAKEAVRYGQPIVPGTKKHAVISKMQELGVTFSDIIPGQRGVVVGAVHRSIGEGDLPVEVKQAVTLQNIHAVPLDDLLQEILRRYPRSEITIRR